MREARLRKDAAAADEHYKSTERIPDVSVVAGYVGLRGVRVFPENTAGLGFMLSWEPFDWGRKSKELAMKKAATAQAGAGLQETEALVLVDVNNRFRKLQEARARFRATSAARAAARERLRVVQARREQQSALVKDLLEAQTALATADQRQQESLVAFWTAVADLEKATGEP
jgi:outer membrane protein TolC